MSCKHFETSDITCIFNLIGWSNVIETWVEKNYVMMDFNTDLSYSGPIIKRDAFLFVTKT